MANALKRLTGKIAENASRRGFFVTVGRIVAGIAAAAASESISASQVQAESTLLCCSGNACPVGLTACPHNTIQNYVWYCCTDGNIQATCHDCWHSAPLRYYCTLPIISAGVPC